MKLFTILMLLTSWLPLFGQSVSRVTCYDEEDGLPHWHVTQLLQDSLGFMWFATWNGLCRYDGYEFKTFKPHPGDGCNMATDRFRDMALRPDGQIVCQVDDDYYLFDTRTCRFADIPQKDAGHADNDLRRYRMSKAVKYSDGSMGFAYADRQGNCWSATQTGVCKETVMEQRVERLDIEPKAQVKCLFSDQNKRYWVATKEDGALRVYSLKDNRLLGYLGQDGRLHPSYTRFGIPVYTIYQQTDGTLWLGSKPDGLYRLREIAVNQFEIAHFTDIPGSSNVYGMAEDCYGRLWIASLGGGLCYTCNPQADKPRFLQPKGYPKAAFQRARYLHLSKDGALLMAATTDGLVVGRLEHDADRMLFRCHQRESNRAESLSSSAAMDIIQDSRGRYFVSTESGGVNRIEDADPLRVRLSFSHYNADNHLLPSDVVLSQVPMENGSTMVVGSHVVTLMDSVGRHRVLDARYFNADYRFSDAHPLHLPGDKWLFGLQDGAFLTSTQQMYCTTYQPQVLLTGVSIQGGADQWAVTFADTLVLGPAERSMRAHFAAIDYSAPERISYAFRLLPNKQWNYIGHDRSATLLDLKPGSYQLQIRSTDTDGQWLDNIRKLNIIVKPTFWESAWGRLLMVLLIVGTLAVIIYTLLYIRRIKRKQRETLEAYLALLEAKDEGLAMSDIQPKKKVESDDPMLQRVMKFVEENIANSDAGVGDMAMAAATSRSGLQRKLKQTMGVTPQDLLREARIKRACQLLRQSDKTVAEVAYACGFTDPKYFSRCFKQSTGQTPTDYKNAL